MSKSRDMKLADWIGKTIQHAEVKGGDHVITFTDGSLVKMKAQKFVSSSFDWTDEYYDIQMNYHEKV